MPILVAVVIAVALSAALFAISANRSSSLDIAEVRGHPGQTAAAAVERSPRLRRFLQQRRDTTKDTGLLLTIAVAFVAIAIVVVGTLLEMVQTHSGFARWDSAAARFGARHATHRTTTALKLITNLGGTVPVVVLVVGVGGYQYWRHRKKAVPAFLVAAVGVTLIVNNVAKLLVNRQRPDVVHLVGAFGSSFPSGHSATAAATYASLALVLGRNRRRHTKALLAGAAVAITAAVAASRVLLGVHWLTDVLAGILVGWGCFALVSIAFGGRVLHFGEPVETAKRVAEGADDGARATADGRIDRTSRTARMRT